MNPVSSRNMRTVTLARNAMATRFEIVLHGEDEARLRAAGEEALAEVDRIEAQLSIFRPDSELARVNAWAARDPVRVTPSVFRLLEQAGQLHRESGRAFDITIAPLMRCWGFMNGGGAMPEMEEVARVRSRVGMEHVLLDPENYTVRFDGEGVMLDPGAIGKGYAIDQAAEVLRDAGVTSALLHGGTSTIYGLGKLPNGEPWQIAIESPAGAPNPWVATVPLEDEALSVSAVWGKFFEHNGKTFGHVIDPRAGQPVSGAVLSAVILPSATETDALSTALLVVGLEGHEAIAHLRPGMRTLVAEPGGGVAHKRIMLKMREDIEKQRKNG